MVQLPVFRVRRQRLEEYLMRVYRMEDFDFLLAAGCTAGAIVEYAVQAAIPPSPDAARQADNIRRGQRPQNVPLILNVLCLDGYIPAGRYIIDTRPEVPIINQYRALLQQTGDPLAPRCLAFKETHSERSCLHSRPPSSTRLSLRCGMTGDKATVSSPVFPPPSSRQSLIASLRR